MIEQEKDRKVLPRWMPFGLATKLGLNRRLHSNAGKEFDEYYVAKISEYSQEASILNACDLVSAAIQVEDFGRSEVIAAANFLTKSNDTSQLAKKIGSRFLELANPNQQELPFDLDTAVDFKINHLKQRVRAYPGNALTWTDLAFFYTTKGQNDKAERCIQTALSLSDSNRHVLRSASRFFIHTDDPEKAKYYLERSQSLKYDPWVLATSIALNDAYDFEQKNLKRAMGELEARKFSNFHLSELAAAVGTVEFISGGVKKSKKIFRLGLEDPNENSFSQVVFYNNHLRFELDPVKARLAFNYEADYRVANALGNYEDAASCLWRWLHFQPFSSEPAIQGSYICSTILGDYEQGCRFAAHGLISSPKSFLLLNNLAFSLANLSKVEQARKAIQLIKEEGLSSHDLATLSATRGLIQMREGFVEEGRRNYEKAILTFKKMGEKKPELMATFFLSLEEKRLDNLDAYEKMIVPILELAKKNDYKDILHRMKPAARKDLFAFLKK